MLNLRNSIGQGFGSSQISNNGQECMAVLSEHLTSGVKVIRGDSPAGHYGPFGGQTLGYGPPEAASRTHDQTNATGNPKIHIQCPYT
jgi:hypothetical protein